MEWSLNFLGFVVCVSSPTLPRGGGGAVVVVLFESCKVTLEFVWWLSVWECALVHEHVCVEA